MSAPGESIGLIPPFRRPLNWRGRSGRSYALVGLSLERFALEDGELYVVAKGSLVLWVGSNGDLVTDPMSRSRFRLALDCADRAYRVTQPGDDVARLTTIWDLEGAEPQAERTAA